MCGVSGIYLNGQARPRPVEGLLPVISRMTDTLSRRGPDARGIWRDDSVLFGHRRLSILDLTDSGAQPMQSAAGQPVITYNGEVYNFAELRRELEAAGCVFKGHSDTEVVLQAYTQWGMEGLKRLEGIFALAVWDPRHRRLVLMRDRLGVKPLFFGNSEHGLAFGSEIKAVLAAGGVDQSLDNQSFAEYLWYGTAHQDRTFYKGVRSLEPGHWMIIENGRQRIEPWWRIEEWLERPNPCGDIQQAAELVRDRLDESVARQLVADVPVGLFLSGGLDSSSIAATASLKGGRPLSSFCAGFDFEGGVNELPQASRLAKHLGLAHHELAISGSRLPDVLQTLARAHDEPFGDAANIPLYLMSRELAGKVKVVLQGDGGDELFGGYRRYTMLRNLKWWRFCPKALSGFSRAYGSMGRRLSRMLAAMRDPDPAMRMAYLLTLETAGDPPTGVLQPDKRNQLEKAADPFLVYRRAEERFGKHEIVQKMLLTDLTVQLPSQFLNKVDRSTMAAGIEARVPLLDERLMAAVVNMPSTWKVSGGQTKRVLRLSQRERLPEFVLHGPKTGFSVPFEYWLKTSLYKMTEERLNDRQFIEKFGFQRDRIQQILKEHKSGQRDRGYLIWKILQLSLSLPKT